MAPLFESGSTITSTEAIITTLITSSLYVGILYIPCNRGDRNDRRIIRNRSASLILLTITCLIYHHIRLDSFPETPFFQTNPLYIIFPILFATFLTLLLYAGPLLTHFLPPRTPIPPLHPLKHPHIAFRNYILAPITEELIYRRFLLTLILQSSSPRTYLLLPSITFALSHLHHLITSQSLPDTVLQIVYTFIFALYTTYLFLIPPFGSYNILAAITAHTLCNMLGLPNITLITNHPKSKLISCCYIISISIFSYSLTLWLPSYRYQTLLSS